MNTNKTKLAINAPKRIFTFGCSYTDYMWGTWANIIGSEFPDAEFRNLGKSGAGNVYMHNIIMQADSVYKFNQDDLILVEWTNVCREDRYLPEQCGGWTLTGNIFTRNPRATKAARSFVKNYVSEIGSYVRDFAIIKSAEDFIKHRSPYHMIKMLDFDYINQWTNNKINGETFEIMQEMYKPVLDNILPGMNDVLWGDDFQLKKQKDRDLVHENFSDGHPSPVEHYDYVVKMFDHNWSSRTAKLVAIAQQNWIKILHDDCVRQRRKFVMNSKLHDKLRKHSIIYNSLDVDQSIKRHGKF